MSPAASTSESHRGDAEIFADIRKALDDRPSVPATVRVHVDDAVVWLTGTVRLARERLESEDVVRGVAGVQRVVNKLLVTQRPNEEGLELPEG